MLNVVTQDGTSKFELDNYFVENNMVKTTIFSAAATFILATYKDNKSAQKVFDIMVSREIDGFKYPSITRLPTQENLEKMLKELASV